MQNLLFENPWPLVMALVATAAVLRLVGFRNRRPALTYAAMGAVLLAVGVYVLSAVVTTDRERIMERTRALVAATAPLDLAVLDDVLAPGAFVSGPDGSAWVEYERVRVELQDVVQRYQPAEHSIRDLQAEAGETRGVSVIDLRTSAGAGGAGLPVRTVWRLHWRKEGDGQWRVAELQWLEFMGQSPSNMMWR
jgi:ketosteroid isomerase-like protein